MQKMHITLFCQFTLFKNIINMPCYHRLIFLEQFCHLLLSQPNCLITHSHFQTNGFIRLVHHDLTFC